MVILVPDRASADEIARLAGGRYGELIFEVIGEAAMHAVTRARAQHGGVPMAFVASSHAEAPEAITAGADEAMPLPERDSHHVLLLLDRTAQRATLRRASENERTSAVQSEKL